MKKWKKIVLIAVLVLVAGVFTFAKVGRIAPLSWGHNAVNQPMFSDQAINGYDAVAYFTESKAVAGNETISHQWNEATWNFSSEENKALFVANPEQYAPQFGGYCSFAVSTGFTANTDPNSFEIIDEKLFLFSDDAIKADWKSSQADNLAKCETNWE